MISLSFTATVNESALIKDLVENTATVQVGDDLIYTITYKNDHSVAATGRRMTAAHSM